MGNRAIITTEKKDLAVYLHWNGGRDSVEPFLAYCKMKGFLSPDYDSYGWARLCQVVGNFFGGTLSLGIDKYSSLRYAGDDNGEYVIKDWDIVDRVFPYEGFVEQMGYDFDEMLLAIDKAQPESEQMGDYLIADEVPTSSLKIGDKVYVMRHEGKPEVHEVVGFGSYGMRPIAPYVDLYGNCDFDYSRNINNYIYTDTTRKAPCACDVPEESIHDNLFGCF